MLHRQVIGIVGAGQVGMAAAYAVLQQKSASEIVLVDRDQRRAEGEAMDLMHAQGYVGRCRVRAGGYADLAAASVIMISAGVGQRPGESRLDLLNRNAAVFGEIAAELDRHAPEAILLIATNPVDVLTYVMQSLSRRPARRIIGTGTMLDTTRFRTLLSEHYGCDPRSVHALIVGEHGDTEVPAWSCASIAGTPIVGNTILGHPYEGDVLQSIFERVRRAAYEIIERKGYTNWAIGLVLAHLLRTIQDDQNSLLPVSVRLDGEYGLSDVCLSLPAAIGIDGVNGLAPPPLDAAEEAALRDSARVLRASLDAIRIEPPVRA